MSDIDIHHLGAAYALDALDERERTAFEAHYPSCEVCRTDVLDFRATVTRLAEASAAAPPDGLKASLMAEVAKTRQLSPLLPAAVIDLAERRRRRQRMTGGLMAVAAAVIAFSAGAIVVDRNGQPAYTAELDSIMGQTDARLITLGLTDDAPGGSVRVAWSETTDSAVLLADDLPSTPDGQAYELWLIGADGPVPMSMLADADAGELREVIDIDQAPAAWGVTVEPDGGSPTPTGDILFLSEV